MKDNNLLIKISETDNGEGSCCYFFIDTNKLLEYKKRHGKVGVRDLMANLEVMRKEVYSILE